MFDLEKPILHQLWSETYSKKEYFNWIHKPIPKTIRIFESNYLEIFTKTPWFVVPTCWIPYIFSIWLQYAPNVDFTTFVFLIMIGAFVWPMFEYTFHRFVFHVSERLIPEYNICYCVHFLLHGLHHLCPQDKLRLVMPIILFWSLMRMTRFFLFRFIVIPENYGWLLTSGVIMGYIYYDLIHYYLHNGSNYYRQLRTHHFSHHYKQSIVKFGVSSKWIDIVMGTQ